MAFKVLFCQGNLSMNQEKTEGKSFVYFWKVYKSSLVVVVFKYILQSSNSPNRILVFQEFSFNQVILEFTLSGLGSLLPKNPRAWSNLWRLEVYNSLSLWLDLLRLGLLTLLIYIIYISLISLASIEIELIVQVAKVIAVTTVRFGCRC